MNCCNNIRNEKAMIMKNIYELGFALVETMLYLDTHPDDAAAIEYYAEIKDKYVQFMKKYSDYYGPLSMAWNISVKDISLMLQAHHLVHHTVK